MEERKKVDRVNQYQMSDDFYDKLLEYLKKHKLTLREFANNLNISYYALDKICDRKIKMHCYIDLLEKIYKAIKD